VESAIGLANLIVLSGALLTNAITGSDGRATANA
jgi:hypothetical protein